MMKFVPIVGIMLIMFGIGFVIYYSPVHVTSDYSIRIPVDKSDKIENAISTVVSNLEKRDFVPVHLEVNWHPFVKTYVIYVKGIDRTKLVKYEP